MQYLISMYYRQVESTDVPEDLPQIMARVDALNAELRDAGAWVFAAGLGGTSEATVVADGEDGPIVTDGPYLETHEALGGFWVIEAPDAAAAQGWAVKASAALGIPVEVRPVQG